ncbi:MAG: hypothetical protein AM326_00155 [Candidatus Thorarchaeota archaeon SMTZ-45]|nr:MAG: hypothetical protein AM326_00155 [Candidatus Thorarchaeota archaeon SMTZ-45]
MNINIGYIESESSYHDGVVIEIFKNMMGLPVDLITQNEKGERPIEITFKDTNSQKELELFSDNKKVYTFDRMKYQLILSALSGLYANPNFTEQVIAFPIITSFIFEFMQQIKKTYREQELPLVQKWFWPDRKEYAICITHDIDSLVRQDLTSIRKRLKRTIFLKFLILRILDFIFNTNLSPNFADNVNLILELERKLKLPSTFFIFSNSSYYDIDRTKFEKIVQDLEKESEVGLHGSTFSYDHFHILNRERNELRSTIDKLDGIRQHFLNFSPLTWIFQSKIGFKYDSSISYNDRLGFRSGLCHPYIPIDPLRMCSIDILEIPLSFMDATLWHFISADSKQAFLLFNKTRELCRRYNGVLVLDLHNIYYNPFLHPDPSFFLQKLYRHISKLNNAWKATLSEIYEWWMRRRNINLNVCLKKKLIIELKTETPTNNLNLFIYNKEKNIVEVNNRKRIQLSVSDNGFH